MNIRTILIAIFTILAIVFLFFSLRSKEDQIMYTFIALGMWGVAFLLNRFKPKKDKTE